MNSMTYLEAQIYVLAGIGTLALILLVILIVAAFFAPIIEDASEDIGAIGFDRRRASDVFDLEHRD